MFRPEDSLNNVNTFSAPSKLRITDIRTATINGLPFVTTLIKIHTNQGIVGLGEIRDGGCREYALMLKSRLLGENPCNVEKLFRRIKQFGGHGRQGGGVSAIEIALWDLVGKAYGVPVWQLLGGKYRNRIRLYCDTDVNGRNTSRKMGEALKKRIDMGYTFLKMDLGVDLLPDKQGMLNAPIGYLQELQVVHQAAPWGSVPTTMQDRANYSRKFDMENIAHPFTGLHLTEKGLNYLEQYMAEVREIIGYHIPLAIDHIGHISLSDCIRLARRLEKYNPAWIEDCIPWQLTKQWSKLSQATATPLCTGEDIYLSENFQPLLDSDALAVVHPDVLTVGGILETKKVGDLAQSYGTAMAIHMAGSPIACMAAAHAAAATENFLALEFHSADTPDWHNLVIAPEPLIQDGFVHISDRPGLGIDDINDEMIQKYLYENSPEPWSATEEWDQIWCHDRIWS